MLHSSSQSAEYNALRAQSGRGLASSGAMEEDWLSGGRMYLRAGERINMPFRFRTLRPPEAALPHQPPPTPADECAAAASKGLA